MDKKSLEKGIRKLSRKLKEPDLLLKERLKYLERFLKTDTPGFRYGISVFLEGKGLDLDKINPLEDGGKINIHNGGLSKIRVMNFTEAFAEQPGLMEKYFFNNTIPEDKFDILQTMFWNQGLIIHIPEGVKIEDTIHIDIKMVGSNNIPYVIIIAEPLSEVSFVETLSSDYKGGFRFNLEGIKIFVKEGATVNYASIQNLSQDVFNISCKRAIALEGASINWIDCSLGGLLNRSEVITYLNGRGSSTNNWGMFFGNKNQQFDISARAIHNAEQTNCDILVKGALDDSSKAIFRGLIKIRENAGNSNGYQKQDTILLSKGAEVDPIPNLEINNSNVKCSHGVSVGQIDPEKIFYLMSRGLPEAVAERSIVEGFFEPMINKISIGDVREDLRNHISKRIIKI